MYRVARVEKPRRVLARGKEFLPAGMRWCIRTPACAFLTLRFEVKNPTPRLQSGKDVP